MYTILMGMLKLVHIKTRCHSV